MPLGTEAGLGSGHIVLHADSGLPLKGAQEPHFSAHVCYGQTAGCSKIPFGMEVGLAPGHIVLDGHPTLRHSADGPPIDRVK